MNKIRLNKNALSVALLGVIAITSLLIRLPFVSVPLERDEGEYAYTAQRMDQGEIPYKDVFDQKPPGIFCIYWLIFKTLGTTPESIHMFTYIYTLIEILLIYKLGKMLFGQTVGLVAASIFSLITMEPCVLGHAANTEIFMLLPLIASLIILASVLKGGSSFPLFVCGLLNGVGFMIKQVALLNATFILAFMLYDFYKSRERRINILTKRYLLFALGFLTILLPIFAFFEVKGAWDDFLYGVFLHNFAYSTSISLKQIPSSFGYTFGVILRSDITFWVLSLYSFRLLLKRKNSNAVLVLGWFLFSFMGVCVGWHFRPHYFIQIAPPLALTAGYCLVALIKAIRALGRKALRMLAFACLLMLIVSMPLIANYKYLFVYTPEQICKSIDEGNPFVEAKRIAQYLKRNTSPEDTIYIFGSEPEILFYAERKSATKYIFFYPLMGNFKDASAKQRAVIGEVKANKPKYILLVNISMSLLSGPYTEGYIFQATNEMIEKDYRLDGVILMATNETRYLLGQRERAMELVRRNPEIAKILLFVRKGRRK